MKLLTIISRCCVATLLCVSCFITLTGEELKGKAPIKQVEDQPDDAVGEIDGDSWKIIKPNEGLPYNAAIPGFVLHGDSVITIFDGKSKRKIGTETLHFHNNLGMKIDRLANESAAFDNTLFKAEKKGEGLYMLTSTYGDAKIGSLVIEVLFKWETPDISGRMTFTKPDGKPEMKLFSGKHIPSLSK